MEILALHLEMAWRLSGDDITGLKEKKLLKFVMTFWEKGAIEGFILKSQLISWLPQSSKVDLNPTVIWIYENLKTNAGPAILF